MPEIVVGSLSLFLGWLCLEHVSRVRARYSADQSPRSRFYGEKPRMVVPSALGVLFVFVGSAMLALAASERLRRAEGLEGFVSLEMFLILVSASLAAASLKRLARPNSGRENSRGGPAKYPTPASTTGRKLPS